MLKAVVRRVVPKRVRAAARGFIWPDGKPVADPHAAFTRPTLTEQPGACLIEVGANDGSFGIDMAERHPWLQVYAFEPTPQLCEIIAAKTAHLPNYELIRAAVGPEPGEAEFKVSGTGDWGCSSLKSFSGDLDKTWPGREDFQVTETVRVPVVRLEDFISERGIQRVAFLHIDAQGSDLEVLQSAGRFLPLIQRGVVEVATSRSVSLYEGGPTLEDGLPFLAGAGLKVDRILSNDPFNNEVNVYFSR